MLICLGGLPASGKTTIGSMLAELYGEKAVLIDPDLTRLEVLGRPLTDKIRNADLTPEITEKTIAAMLVKTRAGLDEGKVAVVPSAFVLGSMRLAFEKMAEDAKVPFHAVWFDAPIAALHARALERQQKSDAGVIDITTVSNVGPDRIKPTEITGKLTWPILNADQPRQQVLADVLQHLPPISLLGIALPKQGFGPFRSPG